jgi:YHS domain-containing protein
MRGQYKDRLSADQIRDQYEGVVRMTDSLDDGRVSFGNRDEIELATAVDPVCGKELRRADAAAAIDVHGTVYFFHSLACRDAFVADPAHQVGPADEDPQAGP